MSLRLKLLFIILTLSIAGLVLVGFFCHLTYKEDKLSNVYESMREKNQSDIQLFNAIIEDHELILKSIVSVHDISDRSGLTPIRAYLDKDQQKILGIFAFVPHSWKPQMLVFRGKSLSPERLSWDDLKSSEIGFSLIKKSSGQFLIKKPIGDGGFLAIAFEHSALWEVLKPSEGKSTFFLSSNRVIKSEKLSFNEEELHALHAKIAKLSGTQGVLETDLSGAPHIIAFSRPGNGDLFLVRAILLEKILLVNDAIFKQILSIFIIIGSLALFTGALCARWLTLKLEEFTAAVREMGKENLSVKVSVRSNDELGVLSKAFNTTAEKIRTRTKELQNFMDIQNELLKTLGQGVIIIDRSFNVLPIYSKASPEMFEVDPVHSTPEEILGIKKEDAGSFRELFTRVFEAKIPFNDVKDFAPKKKKNSKQQVINLSYKPVYQSKTENFEYLIVIGTYQLDKP
jgi:HAMP domain-containing protein